MTRRDRWTPRRARLWAVAGLTLLLGQGGCGLEEVEIPDIQGPSGLALNIRMTASPDIIVADGFSSALVSALLSDPNGRPLAGRDIFFSASDITGQFADVGTLRSTGPDRGVGTGLVVRTDSSGAARVAYVAPPRTDMTSNNLVLVAARLVGEDSRGEVYRTVEIELRSAEPRLFPSSPFNCTGSPEGCPVASFLVEPSSGPYRVNQVISFQTTSRDTPDQTGRIGTIVRYEWFFGDGTKEDKPDSAKVYRNPGTYTVVHRVTDDQGAQAAASAVVTVIP